MTSLGKIAFGLGKWVVVPIILATAGYLFLGPQVGEVAASRIPKLAPAEKPESEKVAEPESDTPHFSEPKIEITSAPSRRSGRSLRTLEPEQEPKKRKPRVTKKEEPAKVQTPDSKPEAITPDNDPASTVTPPPVSDSGNNSDGDQSGSGEPPLGF